MDTRKVRILRCRWRVGKEDVDINMGPVVDSHGQHLVTWGASAPSLTTWDFSQYTVQQ
jgi:hypothetical protein